MTPPQTERGISDLRTTKQEMLVPCTILTKCIKKSSSFHFLKSQQKNKYSTFRFDVPNSEAVRSESESNLKAQEDFDFQSSC